MKIFLTKEEILRMICEKFKIQMMTVDGELCPLGDNEVYWEGNPEVEEKANLTADKSLKQENNF